MNDRKESVSRTSVSANSVVPFPSEGSLDRFLIEAKRLLSTLHAKENPEMKVAMTFAQLEMLTTVADEAQKYVTAKRKFGEWNIEKLERALEGPERNGGSMDTKTDALTEGPKKKLRLTIEVDEFWADDLDECAGYCSEPDPPGPGERLYVVTEEWMRPDVVLTVNTIPGPKCMNADFEMKPMSGRIVGAETVDR